MSYAIEVDGLVKRFGAVTAVDGISFTVGRQEVFGFLGPNGAGKTTTIKILATLLKPTAGVARIAGRDVTREREQVREAIGMVFQDTTLDDRLTAEENLLFHGMLYGLGAAEVRRRAAPLLELVGLADRAKNLVRTYSGGMKRRLELVRGFLHRPTVLFLDEPTVGLDPQTRAQIWEYVRALSAEQGVTVFVTTHYMEEAEHCQRIAIMDHGRIVALDTPAGLKRQVGGEVLALELDHEEARARAVAALGGVPLTGEGRVVRAAVTDAAGWLARAAAALGSHLVRAEIHRPTLDDVFLALTGRQIREEAASARDQWAWRGRRFS
jgi:ABC-2 type transport system ATP-binding protein